MMNRPVEALQQSYLRTKATDLASFMQIAQLKANSSNNTIFADDQGRDRLPSPAIRAAPRRPLRLYQAGRRQRSARPTGAALHALDELPNVDQTRRTAGSHNTNDWPYRPPAPSAPEPANFPRYMDMDGENFRGVHALRLLTGSRGWTLERLQAAAYDSFQPGFAALMPALRRRL